MWRCAVPAWGADEQICYAVESLAAEKLITRIDRWDIRTKEDQPQIFSFLEVHVRFETTTDSRVIDSASGAFMPLGETRDAWIKTQTGRDVQRDIQRVPIYSGRGDAQAIALTSDWRVLAVRVPRETLQTTQNYQLQPERYVITEEERGPLRPPGRLLAEIRSNQRRLSARVDGMLGRIEAPPVSDGALLVPLWEATELEPLLALLSEEQQEVLMAVGQQTWANVDAALISPKHFVAADLQLTLPNAVIEQTLELLELVGVIVRVTLPITDQGRVNAFRLTNERDRPQVSVTKEQE